MEIKGKKIVITGASRGIGKAFAERCAADKCHLILVSRKFDADFEQYFLKKGASSVTLMPFDLAQPAAVETLLSQLIDLKIDVIFNNAGLLTGGLIEEQPWPEIQAMLQVNVNALIRLTQGLIPGLVSRGSGLIINNSSVSSIMYFPCASTYAASKAAVTAFTQCIETELKGTGVETLLLITPGIKTKMFDEISDKYSKNLEIPQDSMTTEKYAEIIHDAIIHGKNQVMPTGTTGLGLRTAQYAKPLFLWAVQKRFSRVSRKS